MVSAAGQMAALRVYKANKKKEIKKKTRASNVTDVRQDSLSSCVMWREVASEVVRGPFSS